MADFETIKTEIQTNIRTNGNQEITGAVLQSTLLGMVDATEENVTELEQEIQDMSYNNVFNKTNTDSRTLNVTLDILKKGRIVKTKVFNLGSPSCGIEVLGIRQDNTYFTLETITQEDEFVVIELPEDFVILRFYNKIDTAMYDIEISSTYFDYYDACMIEIEETKGEITDVRDYVLGKNYNWNITEYPKSIKSNGTWVSGNYTHVVLRVSAGDEIVLVRTEGTITAYAGFVKTLNALGESPDYSDIEGFTTRLIIPSTATLTCPSDAKYLLINCQYGNNRTVYEATINGVKVQNNTIKDYGIDTRRNRYVSGLNIAYSNIGVAPINTAEHFLTAAKLGFNALKADIEVTSDNVLVCCHDSGFTFDGDGRITSYNSSDATLIHDMTWEQISTLEYVAKYNQMGHYAKVCTIEDFLIICREYDVIPYVTLRNTYTDVTIPAIIELFEKYGFINTGIINKYPQNIGICQDIRKYNKDVMICYTTLNSLSKEEVDQVNSLGNACICVDYNYYDDDSDSKDAADYAKSLGIPLLACNIYTGEAYQIATRNGLLGGQIGAPILNYSRTTYAFQVEVSDNVLLTNKRLSMFDGTRFTADVSYDSDTNIVTITNIQLTGSNRYFPDGIMPLWLNSLPYDLSTKSNRGHETSKNQEIWWDKTTSAINIKLASGNDLAWINVTV